MENSRREAAFTLARWYIDHRHIETLLPDSPERAFIQDLVFTAVRRERTIDFILRKFIKKMPTAEAKALLHIGCTQIFFMPSIPDFAAVNETVNAAKQTDKKLAGFVNAVLRNMLRKKSEIITSIDSAPLSVKESFPDALIDRWIKRFGTAQACSLAQWHNQPATTWLARRSNIHLDETLSFEKLPHGNRIDKIEGFESGAFIVQDPATSFAIKLLNIKENISVLDACAAPGGKTIQIAWRLNNSGKLIAIEQNPKRLLKLNENLTRCQLHNFVVSSTNIKDALETAKLPTDFKFDRILLDVPCSNSGVLRRRVDARWNWSLKKLKELTLVQKEILLSHSALLKPNGILVYSTCSNEPEENLEQIESFLKSHPQFKLLEYKESIPTETGFDGSFAAAIQKI